VVESGEAGTTLATRRGSDNLLTVQALRGVAALSVAIYHAALLAKLIDVRRTAPDFTVLAAGVDIFFVISGFIMVYASERLYGQPGAPKIFFLRRLARIVPLYWAVTGALLFAILWRSPSLTEWNASVEWLIASFLFIPLPRPGGSTWPLVSVGWTLNYEMFFYVIFAFALTAASRRAVVLCVSAVLIVLTVAGFLFAPLPPMLTFYTEATILEFVLGMAIALAYREGIRFGTGAYLMLAAGIAGFVANVFVATGFPRLIEWGLPSALVVGGLVLMRRPPLPNSAWRVLGFFGDASYAIYLAHLLVYVWMVARLKRFIDPDVFPFVFAAALLAMGVLAGIVVHLVFERPVTRALQARLRGATGRSPPQTYAPVPTVDTRP
jgi:peptidoglycan/LPS O-acetylase OafA/YrhL